MYANGLGGPQNDVEAVKWFRMAANQGNAVAQGNLGDMYVNGEGVDRDYVQAHMWLALAASQGDTGAVKGRALVAKKMAPHQIAEAQRLARDWKPK